MNHPALPDRDRESSLRDVYAPLFRRKKLVVIAFVATTLTVMALAYLLPETYRSEARLLIRLGRESVALDPTVTTGQYITTYQSREQEINSELAILTSRELAEDVVDRLGVEVILDRPQEQVTGDPTATGKARDTVRGTRRNLHTVLASVWGVLASVDLVDELKERDVAVLSVMNSIHVEVEPNSTIIFLAYEAKSSPLANVVVRSVVDAYLAKHIDVHAPQGSYGFFTEQTDLLRNELMETERQIEVLKQETGIASLDEQRTDMIDRVNTLKKDIDDTNALLAESQARVSGFQEIIQELDQLEPSVIQSSNEYMHSDLYKLQLRELELLSAYSDSNREVIAIKQQIEEARRRLDEDPQSTVATNPAYQNIKINFLTERSTLTALTTKVRELEQSLGEARGELNDLVGREAHITQLERERDIKEANYRKYSENLEQSRIDQELQQEKFSNISVIQAATLPMKPVKPNKPFMIMLGTLFALFGSVALAFIADHLDHSIKTPEDIAERLGMPTLTSIPHFRDI